MQDRPCVPHVTRTDGWRLENVERTAPSLLSERPDKHDASPLPSVSLSSTLSFWAGNHGNTL